MKKKDLDSLTEKVGNRELKSRSSQIMQAYIQHQYTRNETQPDALYPSKTNIVKGAQGSMGISAEM